MRTLSAIALGCLLGCSSSSTPSTTSTPAPSCSQFAACGGAITGTWKYRSVCVTSPAAPTTCPQLVSKLTADWQGTVTYKADGTYAVDAAVSFVQDTTLPKSCLIDTTCADFAEKAGASCTESADACKCHDAIGPKPFAESGTYKVEGSKLVTTSAGETTEYAYCVTGNTLTIREDLGEEGAQTMALTR